MSVESHLYKDRPIKILNISKTVELFLIKVHSESVGWTEWYIPFH